MFKLKLQLRTPGCDNCAQPWYLTGVDALDFRRLHNLSDHVYVPHTGYAFLTLDLPEKEARWLLEPDKVEYTIWCHPDDLLPGEIIEVNDKLALGPTIDLKRALILWEVEQERINREKLEQENASLRKQVDRQKALIERMEAERKEAETA